MTRGETQISAGSAGDPPADVRHKLFADLLQMILVVRRVGSIESNKAFQREQGIETEGCTFAIKRRTRLGDQQTSGQTSSSHGERTEHDRADLQFTQVPVEEDSATGYVRVSIVYTLRMLTATDEDIANRVCQLSLVLAIENNDLARQRKAEVVLNDIRRSLV